MALVSFGGGGDPSGLFASLNRQHLQDIEALAERAVGRAAERSDAEDRDTFDQWQNGLIDDDAWLAYIAERVAETAGDPKEHQQWIEAQREYTTSIADNKMEFAYNNGRATINQIIDYYKSRLGGMDEGSQAYREISGRMSEYIDKRHGDDIQAGAQDITDRIVMGKATLADLIKFYQGRLGGLRKNSSLYEQIQKEIRDLQSREIQDQYSGSTSSGGSSTRRSSGSSGTSYGSTSSQYNAATDSGLVPRNSAVAGALEERDLLGVSNEARLFSGVLPGMSEADSDDYIQGARAHANYMLDQFADDYSDSIIVDPNTGMEWENTPENAQIWAYEYIDLSEMRARGQETGSKRDESNARFARTDIGEAIQTVQRANLIPVEDAEHRLTAEYNRQLSLADRTGDPENVMAVNATFGRAFERLGEQALINETRGHQRGIRPGIDDSLVIKELKPGVGRIPEQDAERLIVTGQLLSSYGSGDADQIMNAQTAYRRLDNFDFTLVDNGPEIWGDVDRGFDVGNSPAALSIAAVRLRDGVNAGTFVRVYDADYSDNGIAIVPTAAITSFNYATGETSVDRAPMSSNYEPGRGDKWELIYTDDRNGNPVATWVISRLVDRNMSTYVAGQNLTIKGQTYRAGDTLTASDIGGLSDTQLDQFVKTGQIGFGSAGQVRTYSYRYGNTTVQAFWNEDLQIWTESEHLQQGLDIRGVGGRLAVVLDDQGGLGGHARSYAHLQGRPVQYHGSNPQKFQEMINTGKITVPHWGYKVDETGTLTAEENDFRSYWDGGITLRKSGLRLNNTSIQWADPEVVESIKKEKRELALLASGMSAPGGKDSREKPGTGLDAFGDMFSGIMGALGIGSGDPNKQAVSANSGYGSWAADQVKGESAFARVQLAERQRTQRAAAAAAPRIVLPNIPLPRATGTITPRTTVPSLPTVRTGINVGGEKRVGVAPAPVYKPPVKAPITTKTPQYRTTPNSGGARVI